jgi:hypothetical protein
MGLAALCWFGPPVVGQLVGWRGYGATQVSADLLLTIGALGAPLAIWWALRAYCARHGRPRPGVDAAIGAVAFVVWLNVIFGLAMAVPTHVLAVAAVLPGIGVGLVLRLRFGAGA